MGCQPLKATFADLRCPLVTLRTLGYYSSRPVQGAAHILASAAPGDSRVFCPDAEGELIHTYTVTPTAAGATRRSFAAGRLTDPQHMH